MGKLVENCVFLAIGCSNVATGGGGAPGVMGREGWATVGCDGGQQRGGGGGGQGGGGGSTVGVSSTSRNCPSQHKYKSPKQFELKGSKST